jgi:hypothetical protein
MAERNDALAYQTLDYIREHPEEWDQKDYFCGTTACFAGRAIILTAQARGVSRQELYTSENANLSSRLAMQLLGWDEDEAWSVFNLMTRDFGELERAVKDVLNGEYLGPLDLGQYE